MKTRIDYGQVAAKLDYTALERKLTHLAEREPPRKRKTAADALEPLREKLLALHRKGWSSGQLVEELKAAGVPVSPARFRECLNRWNGKRNGKAKSAANRPRETGTASNRPSTPPIQTGRNKSASGDGQPALRLTPS
jgi:hypothetical protein